MKRNKQLLSILLFSVNFCFAQNSNSCYLEENKVLLKTELKSLTDIYKSLLGDCNASSPRIERAECETDLSNIKNNIEQLTALNSLIETLGCSYLISKDDKPCSTGKYCQSYKIEDKSNIGSDAKSEDEIKASYNSELKKIKAQNRQEFFEVVFKIVGLLADGNGNGSLLDEIKKLISGEAKAANNYMILNKNESYIDDEGKRQGYKVSNPDGSSVLALDTDEDGKVDRAISYNKHGKITGEHPMVKKRISGVLASTKILSHNEGNNSAKQQFNFYSDCVSTLDVKGFKYVCPAWEKPGHEYLFIIGATVKDCGESKWNLFSPTADVGLVVKSGDSKLETRLFGPYNEGIDEANGSSKYEWLGYCSMRYNNFAVMDIDEHSSDKIHINATEGDDQEKIQGPDDEIFDADISLSEIRKGNIAVTGTCDIKGKCATLYFAIGKYKSNNGKFWNGSVRNNVPSVPVYYRPFIYGAEIGKEAYSKSKKVAKGAYHVTKDVAEDAFFVSKKTVGFIYDQAKKFIGLFDHKWVVISYADGFCIFNSVRGYRTMEDVVNTAKGKGGDCDWWPWPEGSKHVCLDSKKNALKMIKKHGKIKDIKWIDHPTKHCGN